MSYYRNQPVTMIPGQMMPQPDSLQRADNMLLSCGTFATYFSACICFIILICFVAVAFYMYTKKEQELIKTNALITERNCNIYFTFENGKNVQHTSCLIKVKYTVDNKEYINNFETSDSSIVTNQTIVIEYAKNDPNIIYYQYMHTKKLGMILFGISGCILIFIIIHLILLNVSDWYKRLQCISMIAGAFHH